VGWDSVRLGEVARLRKGTTDPQSAPESNFELFSIPACDAGEADVVLGSLIKSAKTLVQPDDVLISKLNPHIPRVWQVTSSRGFTQVSSTEFLPLVPDATRLDHGYLRQVLVTPDFVDSLVGSIEAATKSRSRVKPQQVLDVAIPLPPLPEQRRIARLLDEADRLQRLRAERNEKAQRILPALFVEMFGDPETNPMGWQTARVGDIARVIRGASPRPKSDLRYFGGDIPWIKISDVKANGKYLRSAAEGVTRAGADKSVLLSAGTLILSNSASVGTPCILGVDGCIHDGFLAFLDIAPEVMRDFLYYVFLASTERLLALAPAGTQANLNTGIVKSFAVPVPPIGLQERFVAAATKVDGVHADLIASTERTDSLVDSLRSRLFAEAM
jgi:type I restriction enzyme S subunit